MLSMTPRTPSNMEVKTLCFGGVFLLSGQGIENGSLMVFQHDNDPKHTA